MDGIARRNKPIGFEDGLPRTCLRARVRIATGRGNVVVRLSHRRSCCGDLYALRSAAARPGASQGVGLVGRDVGSALAARSPFGAALIPARGTGLRIR